MSIAASRKVERAFGALQEGNYQIAAQFFDDSSRSQHFLGSLEKLSNEELTITRTYVPWHSFTTAERTALGTVVFEVEEQAKTSNIYLAISASEGLITPLLVLQVYESRQQDQQTGDSLQRTQWPEWLRQLDENLVKDAHCGI